MTDIEYGLLLLTSHLGNPNRKPLTVPQFRRLSQRVRSCARQYESRDLTTSDLIALGYGRDDAERIVSLMDDQALLEHYLERGSAMGCYPLTRISPQYPQLLRQRLGDDAPPCLWYKGEVSILSASGVGLVGSRLLAPENRYFAEEGGTQAARQGLNLISGNAKGSDSTAQDSCIQHGGSVISVIADTLSEKTVRDSTLYLCEDSYDLSFTAFRALSRNRVIHALGECTLVAQCELGTGGTWDGSVKNLRNSWSPLYCFNDGSASAMALQDRGAVLIDVEALQDFSLLCLPQISLFTAP